MKKRPVRWLQRDITVRLEPVEQSVLIDAGIWKGKVTTDTISVPEGTQVRCDRPIGKYYFPLPSGNFSAGDGLAGFTISLPVISATSFRFSDSRRCALIVDPCCKKD